MSHTTLAGSWQMCLSVLPVVLRGAQVNIARSQPTERVVGLGVPVDTIQDATETTHDNYVLVGEGEGVTNDE
jgi:hypothetical protein